MELNPITSSVFLIGMAGGIMADIILNTIIRIGTVEKEEKKERHLHFLEGILFLFLMQLWILCNILVGKEKIEPTFFIFSIFLIGTLVGMGLQVILEGMIRKKARKVFPFVKENLAAENFVKLILFAFILLLFGLCVFWEMYRLE